MSEEAEEKADEYDSRASRRRTASSRQSRPFSKAAAPPSAGRHRFAAPQLDDDDDGEEEDDETDDEELNDTRREEDETDGDDTFEHKYDSRPTSKHTAVYPYISERTERQMSERRPTARRIAMDDTDELDEDGLYQQRVASRDRSSSMARNDRPAAASHRKRFVAQRDDEDEQPIEQQSRAASTALAPFLADSSSAPYLVTPSLLFTAGTHIAPSADPALLLSQALAALSSPPASTTGLAARLPGVTDHFPRQRRTFRAGWGMDGKIALIRGSDVTVTRVKGDEQDSDRPGTELDRERQGRVDMMVALLQVHHEFAEAQKGGGLPGVFAPSLSSSRFAGFAQSSTAIASTSPIATLCDRYITALTALLGSYPPPSAAASTSSLIPAGSFSVASQLHHAISVFQLVKVLYAPEYGSSSLGSFLSTAPSSSSSLPLSVPTSPPSPCPPQGRPSVKCTRDCTT